MTKLRKIGNSVGIVIGSKLLKNTNFQVGDQLKIVCEKNKIVILKEKKE